MENDYINYPESSLNTRLKLSYDWIDKRVDTLLDAGCSYGYGTKYFKEKSNSTYGIDIDEKSIEIANKRYSGIDFSVSKLEKTSFSDNFFDVIIMNDVLEHTQDKIQTLNEMYRILKPDGILILSTPHKGIFQFLDPYNYTYFLSKYFSSVYKVLFKLKNKLNNSPISYEEKIKAIEKHYHYSESDYIEMLNKSSFNSKYQIKKIFKSGLFLEAIAMNIDYFLSVLKMPKLKFYIAKPFGYLGRGEYWIRFGSLSYNIAMQIRKIK